MYRNRSSVAGIWPCSLIAMLALALTPIPGQAETRGLERPTPASEPTAVHKPRIIVTTDLGADPDDEQSLVRLLVSANEFDIEGLIVSTGCWKKTQTSTAMLDKIVDAYGRALPNLRIHAEGYPSREYLKSVSVLGQTGYGMADVGDGRDTPGSELIIAAADRDDPRPVWVQFWGGGNNLAQAVWKIRHTRSTAGLARFLDRIRVFDILGQDDAGAWLAHNFPDLRYIRATGVYGWAPPKNGAYQKDDIQSHGPLGAAYSDTQWATEGDTPAFLHVFPNGLNDPEHFDQGGWGGRFSLTKTAGIRSMSEVAKIDPEGESRHDPYLMHGNTPDGSEAIKRWSSGYDNDFAARMDWSITSDYASANHHPIAVLNGDATRRVLTVSTTAGSTLRLSAEGSSDPDQNQLHYAWSFYREPGTYSGDVPITDASSPEPVVTIPADAAGKTIHIILELRDDGTPSLTAYRRVVIQVNPSPASAQRADARSRLVITTDFPPLDVIPGGAGHGPAEKRSDPDDIQSMVRLLLYSNDFEIDGLIASAGTFANLADKHHLLDLLDLYDQVDENLRAHDPLYPTADHLRTVTWQGRSGTWGKPVEAIIGPDRDSEASQALIRIVDRDDPRPVWIGVWGGPADLAQALWTVRQTRTPDAVRRFVDKLRVFMIGLGDQPAQDGSGRWLLDEFPELFVIVSQKTYHGMFAQNSPLGDLAWIDAHLRKDHGPLGAAYPSSGYNPDTPGMQEGDTPTFLHLVSARLGINDPETPEQPGWGGQYSRPDPARRHWYDSTGPESIRRWLPAIQADLARRADRMLPRQRS